MDKKIKIIKFDRDGEYYEMYKKKGQPVDPFAKFFKEECIIAQYLIPGTPQ